MKFDVIVGNPPYNSCKEGNTKTQPLWDKFVDKAFDLVKEDGHVCLVHPSGWRTNANIYKKSKILKDKHIEYLEIHSEQDGCKTFGASTRYDWYVAKNIASKNTPTTILDQTGQTSSTCLKDMPFIPNSQVEYVYSLLANDGEDTVQLLCDSAYHTQRDHMRKDNDDIFKYPVIYSVAISGPTVWYSSIINGHFNIPKIIINPCRPIGYVVDSVGEYGISQFCVGIVGDADYLDVISQVIANQKTNGFRDFMETCHLTDKIFNKDIIALFRKDFWKDFAK